MIRRSFTDCFVGITEGTEGAHYVATWASTVPDRGTNKCKSPAAGAYFPEQGSRNSVTEADKGSGDLVKLGKFPFGIYKHGMPLIPRRL